MRNVKIHYDNKEKVKFKKYLSKIGYCFLNNHGNSFFKITKVFQMHYRNELVNGNLDKECIFIAQNLSKKL